MHTIAVAARGCAQLVADRIHGTASQLVWARTAVTNPSRCPMPGGSARGLRPVTVSQQPLVELGEVVARLSLRRIAGAEYAARERAGPRGLGAPERDRYSRFELVRPRDSEWSAA
jgi:hypothetical protein